MTDIYDLANYVAECQDSMQELRKIVDSIRAIPRTKSIRPDKRCAVKINTKGHQRKPFRVARSMRRVGRK